MKRTAKVFLLSIFVAISVTAQQTSSQGQGTQRSKSAGSAKKTEDDLDTFVHKYRAQNARKATPPAIVPACRGLESLEAEIDDRFDAENNHDPILAAMRGVSGKQWTDIPLGANDATWDTLVSCADQTKSGMQRAKALRVLAEWEGIRADNFQKQYLATQPTHSSACDNLSTLTDRIEAVTRTKATEPTAKRPLDYEYVLSALVKCANSSNNLNKGKAVSDEYMTASADVGNWQLWEMAREGSAWQRAYSEQVTNANELVDQYNSLLDEGQRLIQTHDRNDQATETYILALEHAAMFTTVAPPAVNCTGTFYVYGSWGTATSTCQ